MRWRKVQRTGWFRAWGAMVLLVLLAPVAGFGAVWLVIQLWRLLSR